MAEARGRSQGHDLSAGQILTLHAEHRKGLHDTPVPECIQCTFDRLVRPKVEDGPEQPEAELP